jgi:hypothetical protein
MARPRLALRSALFFLALCILTAAPASVGASRQGNHKTYANSTFGYSINFPGNWIVSTVKADQFAVLAPDKNAFITANAKKGTLSLSDIRATQKNALNGIGKVQGTVIYAVKTIHGQPFQEAEALAKASSGKIFDVVLLGTDQNATFYDFDAGVVNGTTAAAKEITALQNALKSITIKSQ